MFKKEKLLNTSLNYPKRRTKSLLDLFIFAHDDSDEDKFYFYDCQLLKPVGALWVKYLIYTIVLDPYENTLSFFLNSDSVEPEYIYQFELKLKESVSHD